MRMTIEQILLKPLARSYSSEFIEETFCDLKNQKQKFKNENDEQGAKTIYTQESIFRIQNNFYNAFKFIVEKKYYNAWRLFEQIEIEIKSLLEHYIPIPDNH